MFYTVFRLVVQQRLVGAITERRQELLYQLPVELPGRGNQIGNDATESAPA